MHLLRQPVSALFLCVLALSSGARAQDTRELQQELLLRDAELHRAEAHVEELEEVTERLREQTARTERQLAEAESRFTEAESRLRALGSAPIEGEDAIARRLMEAIATAVELSQRGDLLRGSVEASLESLTLSLGRGGLSEPDQLAVQDTVERLQVGLDQYASSATSSEAELAVADYDSDLRLAIIAQGAQQGIRPGLRLATRSETPQQLLVVEVRAQLSGAIQLDDKAPELLTGEILQPVLETSRK